MKKYVALTILSSDNGKEFPIALVDSEGIDEIVATFTGDLSVIEETARSMASEKGVPFKKRHMVHQRVNRTEEERQLYLTHCHKLGKTFYHEVIKSKEATKEPPPNFNKPNTFDIYGWDNFVSGWRTEYDLAHTSAEATSADEIKFNKDGIIHDRSTNTYQVDSSTIATKLGMDKLEGRALVINPEVISRLSERGVLVDIHIGRWRAKKSISSDTLGLTSSNSDVQKFISSHINLGEIRLIPKELENQLDAIEKRARLVLDSYSIKTLWGRFVPAIGFPTWYEKNLSIRNEFLLLGKQLASDSQSILTQLLTDVEGLAQEVYTRETGLHTPPDALWMSRYRSLISSSFPTPKAIEDSFVFDITYAEVPVVSFSSWSSEAKEDDPVSRMKSIILGAAENAEQISPISFYKNYLFDLVVDTKGKFESVESSLQNTGKFAGKISLSTTQTIAFYRAKRDPEDTFPALVELDAAIATVDAFMIQKPNTRNLPQLLIAVRNVIACCTAVMKSAESL